MNNVIFYPDNTSANKVTVGAEFNRHVKEEYAPLRQQNSKFYADNRGGSPMNRYDSWYYKLGEYAACRFLRENYGLPLIDPDTKIYESRKKSWDSDLSCRDTTFIGRHHDQLRFHVKSSCALSIKKGFPESFMFNIANKYGPGGKDKIFNDGGVDDYCVFVHVPYLEITDGELGFYVRFVVPWLFLKENDVFEPPKSPRLWNTKTCVYTETLGRLVREKSFAELTGV